jgi:hypothetical protein
VLTREIPSSGEAAGDRARLRCRPQQGAAPAAQGKVRLRLLEETDDRHVADVWTRAEAVAGNLLAELNMPARAFPATKM